MPSEEADDCPALPDLVRADGVEFILAMFVDMHGKPCAKLVPAAAVDGLAQGSAGFAGFAAGPMGQSPADPDLIAIPDPASYIRLPWRPEVAAVQCDPYVNGAPWSFAPRVILGRMLSRLGERGLTLKVGAEAEYFLVRRTDIHSLEPADPLDGAASPCYDARGLTRMLDHLCEVSGHMQTLGWENYANDHEDANGQFEQNFQYAEAKTTADRLILFRYMVHCVAATRGMQATFMPKPFRDLTGNGLHLHLSLWHGEEELFVDGEDPRKLGLSNMAYGFIGGLLAHAPAWAAVTCPTTNSYKRMGAPSPRSGATWAPAYAAYGGNNRTHLLRVPEPGRVENRAVDGSANPYLALAALVACGLDGIERGRDPGEPNEDNLYDLTEAEAVARGYVRMPPTLLHAVDNLVADPVLRDGLGSGPGGDYVDYFAEVKRREFLEWHAEVTDWEIQRYLTLF